MKHFEEKTDPLTGQRYLLVSRRGADVKNDPFLNKGTCFTREEREQLGLEGLLPPAVSTAAEQEARVYGNYLQASDEVLMERIAKRNRRAEQRISAQYVAELNKAYNYFFFHYSETPLLAVNTTNADFVSSEREFEGLLRQIEQLEGGTRYYVPE